MVDSDYTPEDLAEMFKVSKNTIIREYQKDKLHGYPVGEKFIRFTQQDVDDYRCIKKNHKTLREYELERKIKTLENKNIKLEKFIDSLKNSLLNFMNVSSEFNDKKNVGI